MIFRLLAPFVGAVFAGWMTVTESITFPGIGLVAVFVAPGLVELYLRLRFGPSTDEPRSTEEPPESGS